MRKKKIKIIVCIVVIVAAIVLAVGAGIYMHIRSQLDSIDRIDVTEAENNFSTEEEERIQEEAKSYTTIALFGLDNRSNGSFESGNSDAIILVSINNDTKELRMASVYRDTFLNTGNDAFHKANYAYSAGGPTRSISMLQKNLDLYIDGYIAVDFKAMIEVVDLLGGVEIEVTSSEVSYLNGYIDEMIPITGVSSSHVSAGVQVLDGTQATAYSRIRYTSGGDFKRAERQRTVLEQIFKKAKSSNYATLLEIFNSVIDDLSTSFPTDDLLGYIKDATQYEIAEMTGFPFEKNTDTVGKYGSIVIPVDLDNNVEELHEFLYPDITDYMLSDTVKNYSAEIINLVGQYEPEED